MAGSIEEFSFENKEYKERCYWFEKNKLKTKKLALGTKIVLCSVTALIILSLLTFFMWDNGEQGDTLVAGHYLPGSKEKLTGEKVNKTKTILLWSRIGPNFDENITIITSYLDSTRCVLTDQQSDINKADVIVFPAGKNDSYPDIHYPNQTWVYSTLTPVKTKVPEKIKFDWIGTFNVNSTIPLQPIEFRSRKYNCSTDVADSKSKRTDVRVALFYKSEDEKNKFKDEVDSLQKLINIDIYECSNNTNSKFSKSSGILKACLNKIRNDYKFYLVLEDYFCHDYISIRFYRALQNDLIPIIWGKAPRSLYELMVPAKKTFLHIEDDFNRNFTLLKTRLEEINSNNTEFNEFFAWKSKYYIRTNYGWLNRLCDKAHEHGNTTMSGLPISELNGSSCLIKTN